jgi:hypothetical protein
MGKASEVEKEKQLGMSVTTARHKLGRMLLFRLYQRLGEDTCFRCGEKIERLEDFSVDHKNSWLHGETALFWDLDNVVASHGSCNSGARRSRPKKYPDGRTRSRVKFSEMYADPVKRDKWNKRRRELYAEKNSVG